MPRVEKTYLLDNNILSYFLNADRKNDLKRIADVLPLVVVQEVHEEALRHGERGGEYKNWQPGSGIAIRGIPVGGKGSGCLAQLRTDTSGLKDLGELASIALAVEDESLVLVMNDKNGLWIALRELVTPGERVLRLTTFLRRAHDAVGLTDECVRALAKKAQINVAPPTWWAEWSATLPSGA